MFEGDVIAFMVQSAIVLLAAYFAGCFVGYRLRRAWFVLTSAPARSSASDIPPAAPTALAAPVPAVVPTRFERASTARLPFAEILFISRASTEFADTALNLATALSGGGCKAEALAELPLATASKLVIPVAQGGSQFLNAGGNTHTMLADQIGYATGVIHLIGHVPGSFITSEQSAWFHEYEPALAEKLDAIAGKDWTTVTYTQMEAYLAHAMGKRLLIAQFHGTINNPCQLQHLRRLKEQGLYPAFDFRDDNDLIRKCFRPIHRRRIIDQKPRPRDVTSMPRIYGEAISRDSRSKKPGTGIFGRGEEQAIIDEAWESQKTKVLAFIAGGGVGKTTLVVDWLSAFQPAEEVSVFCYSFYLQGQTERQVDTDVFLAKIASYFELTIDHKAAPYEKGKAVAKGVMRERALIVLDGMEPLQEAATGRFRGGARQDADSSHGRLTDNGALGFIETLINAGEDFEGLCILTSRITMTDLRHYRDRFVEHELRGLEPNEGAAFLQHLGVTGTLEQRAALSRQLGGHALALLLTGTRICALYGGAIVDGTGAEVDANTLATLGTLIPDRTARQHLSEGARHTFTALDNYVLWFSDQGLHTDLELMGILGLFDRSAEIEAIQAVIDEPLIPGLTDHIAVLTTHDRGEVRDRLMRAALIAATDVDHNHTVDFLDAHPLIREYFSQRLRLVDGGRAFREGHRRLYQHYGREVHEFPDTPPAMAELYRTIRHCCEAGEMKHAFDELLVRRAWRNESKDTTEHNFATRSLGMMSADFVALTQFFEGDLKDFRVDPAIQGRSRFTLLTDIAVRMRSLGRLEDAKVSLARALNDFTIEKMSEGYDGAYAAAQLSELQLMSGEIQQAESNATDSIAYADQQPRTYLKFHARTSLADVLMQKGEFTRAKELFAEAQAIADADPKCDTPFFYSQTCYRYGLYLIETGHAAKLVELARATPHWGQQRPHDTRPDGLVRKRGSLLSSAIDQMILSEAMVRLDERSGDYRGETDEVINGDKGSLNQLKGSGYSDYLARGLNIAARFHTGRGDFESAAKHLEQNHIHVTRGKMKLLEADYLIELCRLQVCMMAWEQAALTNTQATRLCYKMGYARRKRELDVFTAAIRQKTPDAWRQRRT